MKRAAEYGGRRCPPTRNYAIGYEEAAVAEQHLWGDHRKRKPSEDAEHIAEHREAIDSPFRVWAKSTQLLSWHRDSQSVQGAAEDVLQAAAALRARRPRARSYHKMYEEEAQEQANERLLLELDLRSALSHDQFHLVYQPIHDVQQQRLAGCEALIRWIHPDRGFISPAKFIPIAEETGLINAIGEWVLREACLQAQRWNRSGYELPRIGINVSADQLNPDFSMSSTTSLKAPGSTPDDKAG